MPDKLEIQVFVVLTLSVAMAQANSVTSHYAENSCAPLKDERSLLFSLLTVTGYNDTCVAAALDFCSTGQKNSYYVSLMEEARQVAQQLSAAANKLDSQLSAAVNITDSQVTAALNMPGSQVTAAVNECDCQVCAATNKSTSLPRHCKDILDSGDRESGLRKIYPYYDRPNQAVAVFCDQNVDGGGWTVFQQRNSDAVRQDFHRNWTQYQAGFGDVEGEFWLGLDVLHQLTFTATQELRIDLEDYERQYRYAKYGYFYVLPPETKYILIIRNYSGDAGDSLSYHSGKPFTTVDADNDSRDRSNCARVHSGAWWYNDCASSNLNAYPYAGNDSPRDQGITWDSWRGDAYSLKRVSMMTRPAF